MARRGVASPGLPDVGATWPRRGALGTTTSSFLAAPPRAPDANPPEAGPAAITPGDEASHGRSSPIKGRLWQDGKKETSHLAPGVKGQQMEQVGLPA